MIGNTLADKWLQDIVGSLPDEPNATCAHCAMCADGTTSDVLPLELFHPSVKCCTFWPALPNYLVGGLLQDDTCETGRTKLEEAFLTGNVSPLGLGPSASYAVRYKASHNREFGRSVELLCPYFDRDTGGCSVWRYREAVCATWFCKMTRGDVSRTLWAAVRSWLEYAQSVVALWCAHTLGIPSDGLVDRRLSITTELSGSMPLDPARALVSHWGPWRANKEQFFQSCHNVASTLNTEKVIVLGGIRLRVLTDSLRSAVEAYQRRALPRRAVPGQFRIREITEDRAVLEGYSARDPQAVPLEMLSLIAMFDGQDLSVVKSRINAVAGVELPDSTILRLVDFGLLVPVENGGEADDPAYPPPPMRAQNGTR